jgi:putative addiction module killer protein
VIVRETHDFRHWLENLPDAPTRARISARVRRLSLGNPGDVRPVGEGVLEMRIDCGPGYRVYFVQIYVEVVVLLAGGDKSSQRRDISKARRLARDL